VKLAKARNVLRAHLSRGGVVVARSSGRALDFHLTHPLRSGRYQLTIAVSAGGHRVRSRTITLTL